MTMERPNIFGKGMAFPPRVGSDGRLAWSDGESNVRENMRVVLMTEPGERVRLPEFGAGLRRFLFEPNNPATRRLIEQQIVDSLARWEPRIAVEQVRVEPVSSDPEAALATIRFRLVATGALEQVSLSVPVGRS